MCYSVGHDARGVPQRAATFNEQVFIGVILWYIDIRKYISCDILWEVCKMAYLINDECIACGACEAECPNECISEADGKYVIDPANCIDCGACADVCPTGAAIPV